MHKVAYVMYIKFWTNIWWASTRYKYMRNFNPLFTLCLIYSRNILRGSSHFIEGVDHIKKDFERGDSYWALMMTLWERILSLYVHWKGGAGRWKMGGLRAIAPSSMRDQHCRGAILIHHLSIVVGDIITMSAAPLYAKYNILNLIYI